MSWSYSRALVAEYLDQFCSDIEPSALLNTTPTPDQFYWPDKTTEHSRLSRFGMTCVPLTESLGAELLIAYQAGFLAKRSVQQRQDEITQRIDGLKCLELLEKYSQATHLPKTYANQQLLWRSQTLKKLDIKQVGLELMPKTWAQTTLGSAGGYLHTPTTMANWAANSMQKHACCRRLVLLFGKPSPTIHEWMMAWPIGHSGLKPLETGRCLYARLQHGLF